MKKEIVNVGIVLGHGLNEMCELDQDALTRITKVYELLEQGKIQRLILSGGFTEKNCSKISEARAFATWLRKKGVSPTKYILEEESKDTLGNAIFSKKKMIQLEQIMGKTRVSKEIYLITANYHVERALLVFRYIFGPGYLFTGVKSKPRVVHRIRNALAEFESDGLNEFFLSQLKAGDHKQAERLLYKSLPQLYRYDKLQKNSEKKVVKGKRKMKKRKK